MSRKKDVHLFKEDRGQAVITYCDVVSSPEKITTIHADVTCKACQKALSVKKYGRHGSNG